jgi:hypothetical protein
MLEALVEGVKGGVWFSLIDKVFRSRIGGRATVRNGAVQNDPKA